MRLMLRGLPNRTNFDKSDDSDTIEGLPRSRVRVSGSGAVGVRFLRTQQRVKSQCLFGSFALLVGGGWIAPWPQAASFGRGGLWWGFL